ncbi:hypothetical protein F53441_11629 [Fusarium austroafricanum]|uniref:F-box domain-containing protein n=1 Tax=Fusarium austroafricanum TaxID=2364996 RepID=A0A8H4K5E2_9HYPO|nr:hypothetical protein F53441_11629 [Fusarium austroafricanum]
MDQLAPEIISNIISYLVPKRDSCFSDDSIITEGPPLAPLATLCRQWLPLVEEVLFRELRLCSDTLSADSDILTPTRLSYLRQLDLIFKIPNCPSCPIPDEKWNPPEFDSVVVQLFSLLAKIPLRDEPLLALCFKIPPPQSSDKCAHDHFKTGLLDQTQSGASKAQSHLPELPMVRFFAIHNSYRRFVYSPRSFCLMASKMIRVRELDLGLCYFEKVSPLMEQRNELAQVLGNLPSSIYWFALAFRQYGPNTDSVPAQGEEDMLTREIRRFSQRKGLKDFSFEGSVESTVFWPPDSDTTEARSWPGLKSFIVKPYDISPSGKRLVIRKGWRDAPGAADVRKKYPEVGPMNEFFLAGARCVAHMPKAEYFSIELDDSWYTNLSFCTQFPEDPCLSVMGTGGGGLSLYKETVEEWRKTVGIHNLDFCMQVEDEDNEFIERR